MAEAVPDPEMKEMCIMAYSTRSKSSGTHLSVPRRNDFIEVLWCIDDMPGLPEKWCPAEVLHVASSPEQDSLGFGIILYLPGDTWNEQSHNVEFLPNRKLRVRSDECLFEEGEQHSDSIENIPTLDWRFSGAHYEQDTTDDIEWTPRFHEKSGKPPKENDFTGVVSADYGEIERIREAHASLLVEVQKLKREVATLWKQLQRSSPLQIIQNGMSASGDVIPRLRHKLALRMQAPLQSQRSHRKRKLQNCDEILTGPTVDGFQVGTIKARVECTLQEFEYIAREIQTNAVPNSVYFFPSFSYTQLPNQSSAGFRILFITFSRMLEHFGIYSASDKLEMARKCGTSAQGELLRIVSTYSLNSENTKEPAYIFLGTSCGDEIIQHTEEHSEGAQPFPALFRTSREWNKVDQRFEHDLKIRNVQLPALRESASELQAFSISWKRSPELGYRSWSKNLTQPAQVFGSLQISLPFIQTQGRHMCVEVGGLATDDTWGEIFSRE